MIRCIRKLFTLAVVLVLLAAFGYSVVLPRVLPLQYRDIVEQYAAEYGLEEEAFVYGVIFCESHFEPDVISFCGCHWADAGDGGNGKMGSGADGT